MYVFDCMFTLEEVLSHFEVISHFVLVRRLHFSLVLFLTDGSSYLYGTYYFPFLVFTSLYIIRNPS